MTQKKKAGNIFKGARVTLKILAVFPRKGNLGRAQKEEVKRK